MKSLSYNSVLAGEGCLTAYPLKLSENGLTPAQYALKRGSEEAASILAEVDCYHSGILT